MEKNSLIHNCELLIIGGSAGSLEVILLFLKDLKSTLSFPILLVLHRKSSFDSALTNLISTRTKLPVQEAEEKEQLKPGNIYIAPADYHLLIEKQHTVSLDFSEKINYSRPSIDITFQTAAEAYGPSLVCILLSGANEDGAAGLVAVKEAGGFIVIQDPLTAEVSYMPEQALKVVKPDKILKGSDLASFINSI
jgi:two-component system, chemotaxis family, protein-glutamate methylesterase/glutaminase